MRTNGLDNYHNKQNVTYTLITGASAGIGKAMAKECAQRKMNLILVALPGSELIEYADYLQSIYDIKVHYFSTDLTEKNATKQLYEWCIKQNLSVSILINNAGVGHFGAFEGTTVDIYQNIMQLNMQVLVTLTRLFLPELKKNSSGYILNVGSASALHPVPYKCVYSATKSFVLFFSLALRSELKNTNVKVSCLCPNGVITNGEVQKRINAAGRIGRLSQIMSAEKVAYIAIEGLLTNKAVIIPGRINRTLLFAAKFLPNGFLATISANFFRNILNQDPATAIPVSLSGK